MNYGFVSCIPLLVLIVGALITKRIAEFMVIASTIGVILVCKNDFFNGYVDAMYGVLANPSYQFILIILICFGIVIKLFQKSGGMLGFAQIASKLVKSRTSALILAWFADFIMFVDDYLNTLGTTFSMREVTDRNGIPREHLAYQVSVMAPSLCVLIPFASWPAFTVGLLSEQGLGFEEYLKAIPTMWFPIFTIIICFLVAIGVIPKVGLLKESYKRVDDGGSTQYKEETGGALVNLEPEEDIKPTSPLNFIIPAAVLIVVVIIYDNDLVHGLLATIATQVIMYMSQRIISPKEVMNICFDGAKSMANMAMLVFFAFILNECNNTMGFANYIIGGISDVIPVAFLPLMIFAVVAFLTFASAGYWIMQVITIPIFIPLAYSVGLSPVTVISCIMSGVVMGSITCFYSDVIFMTSAGTGVSNIRQVRVSMPYVMAAAVISAVGYTITGFIQ